MPRWLDKLLKRGNYRTMNSSWLRSTVGGSLYRLSDIRSDSSLSSINNQINMMRALARDSQVSTALSYYATDATTINTSGQIIWATPLDDNYREASDIVNALFERLDINSYARDHILELATIGNLYIPTTYLYRDAGNFNSKMNIALDNNTIPDPDFDIVPSCKIDPANIVHLWYRGTPYGFILDPDEDSNLTGDLILPESACIHFSLGGLLGDYFLDVQDNSGGSTRFDIQFAKPLMAQAVQPTQTLNLLEDALVLSSLSRTIKFINVECHSSDNELEIRDSLQQVKDAIEQQLALDTTTGDAQSYVNPQSPNNLIYIPRIDGNDSISVTDLNMTEASESDNKLLQYYQDKKLSVLGVPKEAMNFSSNEGLGGAGSVLSQRSAIYANALQRIETAYMEGWRKAINTYFVQRNYSGLVDKFKLHMNPIVTEKSSLQFDKRDAALGQASSIVDLLQTLGVNDKDTYRRSISEILSEVFPQSGSDSKSWSINLNDSEESGRGMF